MGESLGIDFINAAYEISRPIIVNDVVVGVFRGISDFFRDVGSGNSWRVTDYGFSFPPYETSDFS